MIQLRNASETSSPDLSSMRGNSCTGCTWNVYKGPAGIHRLDIYATLPSKVSTSLRSKGGTTPIIERPATNSSVAADLSPRCTRPPRSFETPLPPTNSKEYSPEGSSFASCVDYVASTVSRFASYSPSPGRSVILDYVIQRPRKAGRPSCDR